MSRALIILIALGAATPALAQHAGHQMPPEATTSPDPHAGHQMPTPADHDHSGHDMPEQMQPPVDPHAGHEMSAPHEAGTHPASPPPAEAGSGPRHAADEIFDPAAMQAAREDIRAMHGGMNTHRFMIDQLEVAVRDGRNGYSWEDVQFWYGGDIDKLWIKSEGEGTFGDGVESAEVQALWSHAISPFFDLQMGLRYDLRPKPDRGYLAVGLQGLAPYWFELDAAAFVSEKGDVSARIEGEYDLRITQKLILQPRAELQLALQDVPELRLGSGLSTAETGVRLRYEFIPEFAPYLGVEYEHAFGDTARFRRAAGEEVKGWKLVLGLRAWF